MHHPLLTAAQNLDRFVRQHLLDPHALCRAYVRPDNFAPYRHDEILAVHSHDFYWQNHPDLGACMCYEDALMATGEWIMSLLARHDATGDPQCRLDAGRSVDAILQVIQQGRHYMPGYLPKPFGGVARARDSHEMSPDQYTLALCALDAWRPHAAADQAAAIDRFYIDAADFFIARKWRHAYRHRTIVTAPTHLHALGLFIALPVLAAKASGDRRYLDELPQFQPALDAAMTCEDLANFNMTTLLISGFDLALRHGLDNPRVRELIAVLWRRSLACVNDAGEGLELGRLPRTTTQVTRMAAQATLVERWHPQIPARPAVFPILQQLREPAQFRHYIHADRAAFPLWQHWLIDGICATSITGWLLACWRLSSRST